MVQRLDLITFQIIDVPLSDVVGVLTTTDAVKLLRGMPVFAGHACYALNRWQPPCLA